MGGGFGGKETQGNAFAALVALAAMRTGRPVRLQLDRDVDMTVTGKRHPFAAKFAVGYDRDGRLRAADIALVADGGWSIDLSQAIVDRALFHLDNAYYLPAVRFSGRVAKTNVASNTAFRGFGGPQGMLVIEEIMDRIARRLGLPPEVVRERNLYHGRGETNTTHYGVEIGDNRLGEIWRRALAAGAVRGAAPRGGRLESRASPHQARARGNPGEVRDFVHPAALQPGRRAGPALPGWHGAGEPRRHRDGAGTEHQDPRRGHARTRAARRPHPADDHEHGQGAEHVGDGGVGRRGPQRRGGGGGVRDPARTAGAGGGADARGEVRRGRRLAAPLERAVRSRGRGANGTRPRLRGRPGFRPECAGRARRVRRVVPQSVHPSREPGSHRVSTARRTSTGTGRRPGAGRSTTTSGPRR